MKAGRIFIFVCAILCLSTLTSCSSLPQIEQPEQTAYILLNEATSVGQTFAVEQRGLTAVDFYFKRTNQSEGQVKFTLRNSPEDPALLATDLVPIQAINNLGFYRFSFPPLADSFNHDYYASLEVVGQGRLRVGSGSASSYIDGSLYKADKPQDAQSTFRLAYAPAQLAFGLIQLSGSWLILLAAGAFLFTLPGWGILAWSWPEWKETPGAVKLALSGGISLCLYPLLFLWTHLVGLNIGLFYAWLPPLLGALLLLFKIRPNMGSLRAASLQTFFRSNLSSVRFKAIFSATNFAYILVTLAIFGVRFWVIKGIEVPLWGDSYQHTVIAQLLVQHNGLFESWRPLADLNSFTYHFGFHSLVAVFHWLTGLAMPASTLWVGQLLNGLAILSLVPLALKIFDHPWTGIISITIAGLLLPMPMAYLNWGRYTQLAGQAILPIAVLLILKVFEKEHVGWPLIILGWISLSGLALTHYRVLFVALVFLLVLLIASLRKMRVRVLFTHALILGAGSFLLFIPWFINLFAGKLFVILQGHLAPSSAAAANFLAEYNSVGALSNYLPAWAWVALVLSFGFQIFQKNRDGILIGLWWLANFLFANPALIGLPGTGALSNFAILIATYIPAGLLISASMVSLAKLMFEKLVSASRRLTQSTAKFTMMGLLVILAGLSFWGTLARIQDVQISSHALVTRPDLRAASWIRNHTEPDARFYVNSFFAYGGTSVVGSDGGWWLPLLAERATNLPPLNYSAESSFNPDYREQINGLVEIVLTEGIEDPQVYAQLRDLGTTHVYLGQLQGRVNNPNPGLNAETLVSSPLYRPVYHQDQVWIFELVEQ